MDGRGPRGLGMVSKEKDAHAHACVCCCFGLHSVGVSAPEQATARPRTGGGAFAAELLPNRDLSCVGLLWFCAPCFDSEADPSPSNALHPGLARTPLLRAPLDVLRCEDHRFGRMLGCFPPGMAHKLLLSAPIPQR